MQTDPKIKLPTPYKIQNKIQNKLNALNNTTEQEILFNPIVDIQNMFYIYLFKKYKDKCFVRDINHGGLGMTFYVTENKQNTKLAREAVAEKQTHLNILADNLVSCIKNKNVEITIIPVTISAPRGSHANLLIYRKKLNHIEHFEPHGKYFGGKQNILSIQIKNTLNDFVSKINEKMKTTKETQIKFIESSNVCPRIEGLQAMEAMSTLPKLKVEPFGYCIAWSLFFAELCLKNPEIPSSDLLTYIFNVLDSMEKIEQMNYLKNVIRGYAVIINEKIEKYFSILYDTHGHVMDKTKYMTKLNTNTVTLLNAIISVEMNLLTDPTYVDKSIQYLQNAIDKRDGPMPRSIITLMAEKKFFELYKKFNVISAREDSSIEEIKPTQVVSPLKPTQVVSPLKPTQVVSPLKPNICPEGKELNPKTGRCIKIKTQKKTDTTNKKKTSTLKAQTKACPEGKELNPKTGRCIKIKTQKKTDTPNTNKKKTSTNKKAETKACPEGKELNPKTGRCIKIKTQKK